MPSHAVPHAPHPQAAACSSHARPRAAPFTACRRAPRRLRCRAAAAGDAPHATSRRNAAALLGLLPAALCIPAGRALIPDDDDEELIEKAKANRRSRLASERSAEKQYAKVSGALEGEVIAVQQAVNKLAKSGAAIAAGDLGTVAATVSDSWVGDFQKASADLSGSPAAKESVATIVQGIGALEVAAKKGSVGDAKRTYVTVVSALQGWATNAGIASSLKGL